MKWLFTPVALIGAAHVVVGASLLFEPSVAKTTGLLGLAFIPWPSVLASLLIGVGVAALVARITLRSAEVESRLIAPQQVVLFFQLFGVVRVLADGAYPDGYSPNPGDIWAARLFILGDQVPLLLLCVSHTLDWLFGREIMLTRIRWAAEVEAAREDSRLYDEGS